MTQQDLRRLSMADRGGCGRRSTRLGLHELSRRIRKWLAVPPNHLDVATCASTRGPTNNNSMVRGQLCFGLPADMQFS